MNVNFSFPESVTPASCQDVRQAMIDDLLSIAAECDYKTLRMRALFPFPSPGSRAPVLLSQTLKFSCDNELVLMYPGVKEEIANVQNMFAITALYAGHGMISLIPYALRTAIGNSFVDTPIRFPEPNLVWGRLSKLAANIHPGNLPDNKLAYLISQSLSPAALNMAGNLSHDLLRYALLPAIFSCLDTEIFSQSTIESIVEGLVPTPVCEPGVPTPVQYQHN